MADIKDNVKIKKIDTALAGEFNKLKLKLVSYLSIAEVEREYLENEAVKAKDSVSSAMTSSNIDDLRNSIDKFKDIDDAMKKFKDSHSKMYAAAKKILTLPDENKEMLVQNGRVLSSGEIISTKDMDEAFEVSQNSLGDVLSSVDRDEIKQAVEKTMTSSESENENSAEADYISNKVNSDNLEDVVRLVKEQAIEEMNKPKTEDDVAEKDEHKLTMEDMDDIFAKARGEAKEEPVVEEPLPSPSEAKPDTPIFSDDESIFNFSPFYVPADDLADETVKSEEPSHIGGTSDTTNENIDFSDDEEFMAIMREQEEARKAADNARLRLSKLKEERERTDSLKVEKGKEAESKRAEAAKLKLDYRNRKIAEAKRELAELKQATMSTIEESTKEEQAIFENKRIIQDFSQSIVAANQCIQYYSNLTGGEHRKK